MAIYRGVDNVARKITKQYRGIDNVARKITKEYRGVDNVARLVFGGYEIHTAMDDASLYNSYTFDTDGDTIGINVVTSGKYISGGNVIMIYISGDLAGKSVSFDYESVGWSVSSSTIYYRESQSDGNETKEYLKTTGSYSTTTTDGCKNLQFCIWVSANVSSNKEVGLTISNLKIDGEPIIFEGGMAE